MSGMAKTYLARVGREGWKAWLRMRVLLVNHASAPEEEEELAARLLSILLNPAVEEVSERSEHGLKRWLYSIL